jgi:hypothetical protein
VAHVLGANSRSSSVGDFQAIKLRILAMAYWYISFATDTDFLGATVVEATSANNALAVATLRGLNPGGEAAIMQIPAGGENDPGRRIMTNRLVGRAEMMARGATRLADMPGELQRVFGDLSERVCQDCNPVRH